MARELTSITVSMESGIEAPCEGGGTIVFEGSVTAEVETGFELLERSDPQHDQMIRVTTAIGDRDGARWEAEEILKAGDLFFAAVRQPLQSRESASPNVQVSRRALVKDAAFFCDGRDAIPIIVSTPVPSNSEYSGHAIMAYLLRMKYFSAAVDLEEEEWTSPKVDRWRSHRVVLRSHVDASPLGDGPDLLKLMPVFTPIQLGGLIWKDAYYPVEEEGSVYHAKRRYPRMPRMRRGAGTYRANGRIIFKSGTP